MKLLYIKSEASDEIDEILMLEADNYVDSEVLDRIRRDKLIPLSAPYIDNEFDLGNVNPRDWPAEGRTYLG